MLVLVQVSSMKTKRSGSTPVLIFCPLCPLAGDPGAVAFTGDDAFF
jgi:hypothetical protein